MPMLVMPQISVPIMARYMRFIVFPAAPTNGVSTACGSKQTKLLRCDPVPAAQRTCCAW